MIALEVLNERARQDTKWGEQNHNPSWWMLILGEEVGEACRAALEAASYDGDLEPYRAELIQVAAVAIAAIECYDRNKGEI